VDDCVYLVDTQTLLGQTIVDRSDRKRAGLLFARESLFCGSRDDFAITNQRRCGVQSLTYTVF
jgi:hypothetical protein